jgi:Protein of unknown function (DUF1778)
MVAKRSGAPKPPAEKPPAPARGRPPKPPGERKGAILRVRLTDAQREVIEAAAAIGGEDLSSWLRRVGLQAARAAIASETASSAP